MFIIIIIFEYIFNLRNIIIFIYIICNVNASLHIEETCIKTTDVIDTIYGPVQGCIHDDIQVFKGIPFAAPPTGANRFRSPKPIYYTWNETLECFNDVHLCPQFKFNSEFFIIFFNCL